MAADVLCIPADRVDELIDCFADAFTRYPVLRFTVGDSGDTAARERRLVELFVRRRMRRGGPAFAVLGAGVLGAEVLGAGVLGASLLTLPIESPVPEEEVAAITAAAWRDLGDAARERYELYAATTKDFFSGIAPHHHLNMLGVRRAHARTGLSRPLLEHVRDLAAAWPGSAGVTLTTENPRNVPFYEHFGYEVVAHARIAPDLESWGLFQPRR